MDFGEQMDKAINNILGTIHRVMIESTIELYGRAIERTPIKLGDAIRSWSLAINSPANTKAALQYNTVATSKTAMATVLDGTTIKDNYYLVNVSPYILDLENGGYNIPPVTYFRKMPHYPNEPPFTLTVNGYSKKAPLGMVKVTLMEAPRVVAEKANTWG